MTFINGFVPDMLTIFEAVPDLYLVLSTDLRILTGSHAYMTTAQTNKDAITGKNILDFFTGNPYAADPLVIEQLRASLYEVIETGKPGEITLHSHYLFAQANANYFPNEKYWNICHTPVLNDEGNVEYILHKITQVPQPEKPQTSPDIETTQAFAEMERNKLYQLLMDAPALICIFEGPRHIFRLVNPPYQQLVGDRSILNKPIREAMPELDGQPIFDLLDKVYQTGEPFYANEMMVQLDHTNSGRLGENYYNFIYQATHDIHGNIDGILVFAYEVTAQVQARKKAQQSEEQLRIVNGELAAGNEEIMAINEELVKAKNELEQLNYKLEDRVAARTAALELASKAAKQQKVYLERLFMSAPAAICILNGPDMVYELVNPYYQQLFPERALLGKPILAVVPEIKEQPVMALMQRVYETGEAFEGNEVLVHLRRGAYGEMKEGYFNFIYQARQNEHGRTDGIFVFAYEVTEQVLARKRVEESAQQLRLITDSLPVLIGYLDREEKYRFANQAYQSWFHQPPAALLGRPVREVVGEKAYQGIKQYIDRALAGERVDFEARMPYRENFVKYIRTSYVPDIQQEKIAGFYTLVTDITEPTEARQRLEESEKRFRILLESIPQITWTALPAGEINFYNERWYSYTGLDYEQTKAWGWQNVLHPDDLPVALNMYRQALSTGEAFELECRIKRADGQYRWHLSRTLPLRNENSILTGWVGTATDIHQQKLVELNLLESERYFRMMADNAPVMMWVTRPDGYCTYLNKPWYEYTGQTEEEAAGLGWTYATHPDDIEKTSRIFMEANESQSEFRLIYRLRRKDGAFRWFTDIGLPRFSQSGKYEGFVGAVLDIHEQKLAEQALLNSTQQLAAVNQDLAIANQEIQLSNRELSISNQQLMYINADLDNFIYTASHDLKAPIVNIEGLLKILVRNLSEESRQNERTQLTITHMQDSIERFKRTIANLTEVVKLQKENSQPSTLVDINRLLEEVKSDLALDIKKAKAILIVDVRECPLIQFAEKNLRSILYNLLSNAIKYRSPERRLQVQIRCIQTEDYQVLTIHDNGLGMNLTGDQKLFSMFRRLHTHVEGSGIGLYMVKKMIDNAGGKIEVESEAGVGSTFKVYFKKMS